MSQVNNYPPPPGPLSGLENLLGQDAAGTTRAIPTAAVAALANKAFELAMTAILSGQMAFALPDEAKGDTIPAPGSGLPYLSGGVFKIA